METQMIPMNLVGVLGLIRTATAVVQRSQQGGGLTENQLELVKHMEATLLVTETALTGEAVVCLPFWTGMFVGQVVALRDPIQTRFYRPGSPDEHRKERLVRQPGSVAEVVQINMAGIRLLWVGDGDWLELSWSNVRAGAIIPVTWKDYSDLEAWDRDPNEDPL